MSNDHIADHEDANTRACQEAAQAAGKTSDQADNCDAGQHACPGCPWRKPAAPEVGLTVWFRPGRMYGWPEQTPARAMVKAVRTGGRVDLEIGCDGLSQVSGEAGSVPHLDSLPVKQREQLSCWWNA